MILPRDEQKKRVEEMLLVVDSAHTTLDEEFPKDEPLIDKLILKLSESSFWLNAYINKLKKENV